METAITMIPMPPSHCSSDRHSSSPGGVVSRPEITVEPVVVMPDMLSKNASVIDSCNSENRKGRAPKVTSATHTAGTSTKACFSVMVPALPQVISAMETPKNEVTTAEARNTFQSGLETAASYSAGSSIAMPSVTSRIPTTSTMGRISNRPTPRVLLLLAAVMTRDSCGRPV